MAKNSELYAIIKDIKHISDLSQAEIAAKIGISPQYLSDVLNCRYPFSEELRAKLSVLKTDFSTAPVGLIPATAEDGIPFFGDLPVTAGSSSWAETRAVPTAYYNIPGIRADFLFPVVGCSMQPEIMPGDVIGVVQLTDRQDYDPDRVYMVVTREGDRMIKRLRVSETNPDQILAFSSNPAFRPITLSASDLHTVYRVTFVARQL